MSGTLTGVGVGPGDPELLTLKAVRVLAEAAVIAFPTGADGAGMARRIAAAHVPPGRVELPLPLTFDPARPADDDYDRAAVAIAAHLDAGRDVAYLCEGDPFFYGSFIPLHRRLANRYPVRVVPGVASPMAAAAALGRPLAERDETFAVIPATLPAETIAARLRATDSAVVLKLGRHLGKVAETARKLGLDADAQCAERVGLPDERLRTLHEAEAGELPYFALLLLRGRGGR